MNSCLCLKSIFQTISRDDGSSEKHLPCRNILQKEYDKIKQ